MPLREPRTPVAGRKAGRPRQEHVASSVHRAREYLRKRHPEQHGLLRALGAWALTEAQLPKRKLGQLGACATRLEALLPPPYLAWFRPWIERLKMIASVKIYRERRYHFSFTILEASDYHSLTVTPTELLAIAVAVGCERPQLTEDGQARLFEAWKKRHAGVRKAMRGGPRSLPMRAVVAALRARRQRT